MVDTRGTETDLQKVGEDIGLLHAMKEYGVRGDLAAKQEWAEALDFTTDQLEQQEVRDNICRWAIYFEDELAHVIGSRDTPPTERDWWSEAKELVADLLVTLKRAIESSI